MSHEALWHVSESIELTIQISVGLLTSADVVLHLINVELALAHVVLDISASLNSSSEDAVEGSSGLEKAVILSLLADLRADLLSQLVKCSIVGSELEPLVLDVIRWSDDSVDTSEHVSFLE